MSNAKAITIRNDGTTSAAFEIGINAVRALELPAAMTGTYSTGCTDIAGTVI